jgi:IS30 family transposase
LDWSPEQIAGWLKRTHPEDERNQVSHETIYRSLFVQTCGVLKKELLSHLLSERSMGRSQPADPNGDRRGHIKDIFSIRQRPAAIGDRAVPGHWEGDLLSGPNNSNLVEAPTCGCTRKPSEQSDSSAKRTTTSDLANLKPQLWF